MSDDFVRDLEEELVAAARFRAERATRRRALPSLARPAALAVVAVALAVLVVLGALSLHGPRDRVAGDRGAQPPPGGEVVALAPMLPAAHCGGAAVGDAPAAQELPWLALLRRDQRADDQLPQARDGALPVRSLDPAEARLAGAGRLPVAVHVIPSIGVSASGECGADDGPGLCLVRDDAVFRCFTRAQVEAGRAITLAPGGVAVGIVPDGIERVTLVAGPTAVSADVVENIYEARLGVPAGTHVRVTPEPPDAGCTRTVAPALADRFPILGRDADPGQVLPRAALDALGEWRWRLDAVVEDGARFWGGGDGVGFWAVPVVPKESTGCAPATGVCVVGVPDDVRAVAFCVWGERELDGSTWQVGPAWHDHAMLLALVPLDTSAVRVTSGGSSTTVEQRDGIAAAKLPFPYRDGIEVTFPEAGAAAGSTVAVVDATGGDRAAAEQALAAIRRAGLMPVDRIVPGAKAQPRTDVYWFPGRATRQGAEKVAGAVGADDVRRVADPERTPRPVSAAGAGIVVVVGGA